MHICKEVNMEEEMEMNEMNEEFVEEPENWKEPKLGPSDDWVEPNYFE